MNKDLPQIYVKREPYKEHSKFDELLEPQKVQRLNDFKRELLALEDKYKLYVAYDGEIPADHICEYDPTWRHEGHWGTDAIREAYYGEVHIKRSSDEPESFYMIYKPILLI